MYKKRRTVVVLMATLIVLSGMVGAPAYAAKTFINMLCGSSTGTWFIVGGSIASVLNKYVPDIQVTCEPGGGSINAMRVGKGETQLGMTMSENAYYAIIGKREYEEAFPNLRAIGGGFMNPMKLITRAESKINSISDLRGKKVVLGYPGSVQAICATEIMETFGMVADKDYAARWLNPGEACDALRDKAVDAMFLYIGDPASTVLELETAVALKFIPYDVDKVIKGHPYWYKGAVKAGTYKCLTTDYECLCAQVILITAAQVDADLVYRITKAIYDHPDELGQVHPTAKEWVLSNALKGVAIPLHPGAEKYFKERGILK